MNRRSLAMLLGVFGLFGLTDCASQIPAEPAQTGVIVTDQMLHTWSAPKLAKHLFPHDPNARDAIGFKITNSAPDAQPGRITSADFATDGQGDYTPDPSPGHLFDVGGRYLPHTQTLSIEIPSLQAGVPGFCRLRDRRVALSKLAEGYQPADRWEHDHDNTTFVFYRLPSGRSCRAHYRGEPIRTFSSSPQVIVDALRPLGPAISAAIAISTPLPFEVGCESLMNSSSSINSVCDRPEQNTEKLTPREILARVPLDHVNAVYLSPCTFDGTRRCYSIGAGYRTAAGIDRSWGVEFEVNVPIRQIFLTYSGIDGFCAICGE